MNIPQSTRTAVIRHVSGQDGAYPAQLVLSRGYPVVETAREAFNAVGLDWRRHVKTDPTLIRPTDLRANPALAAAQLGWQARTRMSAVVRGMADAAAKIVAAPTHLQP